MALPTSPVNGQTATLNGITYVYNSTNNAWKRQTLTDITVTGTVRAASIASAGNVFFTTDNSQISSALVYDLDTIFPDGSTNTFYLRYNQSNITVTNPWNLSVSINGFIQPAFVDNTDVVWFSHALCANSGFTVTAGNVKFADVPPAGTTVRIKTQIGSANATPKTYPFKPLDISLGI